jgi:hypothetical protein
MQYVDINDNSAEVIDHATCLHGHFGELLKVMCGFIAMPCGGDLSL